ncbi:hypothetical protein BGZ80_004536 [Entomortierella chlamydospora]|uniref:Uncharacterized protein n=1 Tax=Entomortierella chlamydospora TaxID=101097 RepID=A0A9P6N400_9FUNG|nr:hypothetical protein BGZ80_004536 [Entomortierella chlamydospora]
MVASGSKDNTVRLWEAGTSKLVYTFKGSGDCVSSAAFSPDGKWVITGSNDGSFSVRNVETGDHMVTISSWNGKLQCLALKGKDALSSKGAKDPPSSKGAKDPPSSKGAKDPPSSKGTKDASPSKETKDDLSLVAGGEDGSVRRWRIIEKEGKLEAILDWSSLHEVLNVSDASFANAIGVTPLDKVLLGQRGATMAGVESHFTK